MAKKKMFVLLLALCLVMVFFAGCGGDTDNGSGGSGSGSDTDTSEPEQTIVVAYTLEEDHPVDRSFKVFKDYVEDNSGSIKVELYPGGEMGSESECFDACQIGEVQICVSGTAYAKDYPAIYAQETPFLFTTWDEAETYLNGDYGNMIFNGFEEGTGMIYLGTMANGFHEFSCNYEIKDMESFKGIRMRIPNDPGYVELINALGGSPVAMSFEDLLTALEQKAVDGQDSPYPTAYANSFYELQKYALESRHVLSPENIFINAEFFNITLTDEQRAVVQEGIRQAVENNWQISEEYDQEAKQALTDNGMEITVPSEEFLDQMHAAMGPVYEWYYSEIPGAEEYIKAVLGAEGRS